MSYFYWWGKIDIYYIQRLWNSLHHYCLFELKFCSWRYQLSAGLLTGCVFMLMSTLNVLVLMFKSRVSCAISNVSGLTLKPWTYVSHLIINHLKSTFYLKKKANHFHHGFCVDYLHLGVIVVPLIFIVVTSFFWSTFFSEVWRRHFLYYHYHHQDFSLKETFCYVWGILSLCEEASLNNWPLPNSVGSTWYQIRTGGGWRRTLLLRELLSNNVLWD